MVTDKRISLPDDGVPTEDESHAHPTNKRRCGSGVAGPVPKPCVGFDAISVERWGVTAV